jgi:NAD+ kinase
MKLSAGGSLVHPEIPALLITPICPHTLSFRPMLLPDTMELRICVPFNSRTTAWASFDGRGRVELKRATLIHILIDTDLTIALEGDHIKVTASKFPFPTVCADNQSTDWFQAISRTLRWNERERQKSFVVVEEGPVQQKKRRHSKAPVAPHVVVDDEEDEDDISDEDDGTFDIDSSAEADQVAQSTAPQDKMSESEHVGRQKAQEEVADDQVHRLLATSALRNSRRASKSRSRSRSAMWSGGSNGNPSSTGRHVEFQSDSYGRSKSVDMDQNGIGDDTRSTKKPGVKSRIAREKDIEFESAKTPTVAAHHRNRSRSADFGRRAFAVWGHDESDSNASDSDTSYEA